MDTGELKRLISGDFPLFDELSYIDSSTAISQDHFFKFFKMRGWITGLTEVTLKLLEVKDLDLPDRFEYHAEFQDQLGQVRLNSPVFSDERAIHTELAKAKNNKSDIELMVFVTPFPKISSTGKVRDRKHRQITYWPVNLNVVDKFAEEGEFFLDGLQWQLKFRADPERYVDEDGFFYIHELLKKQNELLSSLELKMRRKGIKCSTVNIMLWNDYMFNEKAKDKEIDKYLINLKPKGRAKVKSLNSEALKIQKQIDSLDPNLDKELIEECETTLTHIRGEIFEVLDLRDEKNQDLTNYLKNTNKDVKRAILRAFDKIEETQPMLRVILESRIEAKSYCRYLDDPDHPILWLT